ncbi:MAG: PQQ-binding-like beta-propeller repeat protein [Verrucomicrobiota bacterium]
MWLTGPRIITAMADMRVLGMDAATASKQWVFKDTHPAYALLTGTNGMVYVESVGGMLTALNSSTGVKVWEYKTGERTAPPILGPDDVIYVARTSTTPLANGRRSMRQDLVALHSGTGRVLWEFPIGSMFTAARPGPNGRLYAQSPTGRLYALNAASGAKLWEVVLKPSTPRDLVLGADGTIYVEDRSGFSISTVHPDTGAFRWELRSGRPNFNRGFGADGAVHVWNAPSFFTLDPSSGVRKWTRQLEGSLTASSSSPDGTVFLATSQGKLLALDAADGTTRWEKSCAPGVHFTSLTPGAGRLLFAISSDGKLIAFSEPTLQGIATRRN